MDTDFPFIYVDFRITKNVHYDMHLVFLSRHAYKIDHRKFALLPAPCPAPEKDDHMSVCHLRPPTPFHVASDTDELIGSPIPQPPNPAQPHEGSPLHVSSVMELMHVMNKQQSPTGAGDRQTTSQLEQADLPLRSYSASGVPELSLPLQKRSATDILNLLPPPAKRPKKMDSMDTE
jgi:hypothetical protein